jgi:NADPH:quinone reductase-like Zn-dependent oxidoreductase
VIGAPIYSLLGRRRVRSLVSHETRADLLVLNDLIERGQVVPAVTRTLPLERAADALRDADEGHGLGKVAVTIPPVASDSETPAATPNAPTAH